MSQQKVSDPESSIVALLLGTAYLCSFIAATYVSDIRMVQWCREKLTYDIIAGSFCSIGVSALLALAAGHGRPSALTDSLLIAGALITGVLVTSKIVLETPFVLVETHELVLRNLLRVYGAGVRPEPGRFRLVKDNP